MINSHKVNHINLLEQEYKVWEPKMDYIWTEKKMDNSVNDKLLA